MSIIPAGKRREQVAQGPLKNQSILESALFNKFGQGAGGLVDDKKPAVPSDELQQTMNSGGLGHDDMAGRQEADRMPPDAAMQDQQPGIAPAGGAPADQFIGPAPVDQTQQAGINPYEQEVQKIRQFIGYQNYGLELTPQKDGSLEVVITPPSGQPVDIGQLMHGLKQVTQGDWKGESTPAMAQGGPVKLKYVPQSMGTPKVEKR